MKQATCGTVLLCVFVALLAFPAPSQNLITYDIGPFPPPPAVPMFNEFAGFSPLYPPAPPAPGVALNSFPLPPLPLAPGTLPFPPAGGPVNQPSGGVTIDNTNGQLWACNGAMIAAFPHNQYGATVPGGPWPAPAFPGLQPPWTNFVYGIALDPIGPPGAGPILWLTDSFWIVGVAPAPAAGFPMVLPPFPANVAFGPGMGPITGLDWDTSTATLWAVDFFGVVYNMLPGGAIGPGHPVLGNPIPPPPPAPLPPHGIAIDKSGGIPIAGAPLQAIYVVAPGVVFEYVSGTGFLTAPPVVGIEIGITYHAAPSHDPPAPCPCPSPGYAVGTQLLGPMSTANAAFGVDLTGLPPLTPVLFVFDFGLAPKPFGMVNAFGCPMGIIMPPPPPLSVNFLLANAGGVASFPINLTTASPGMWIYMQSAALCPADPVLGLVLSPFYQIAVSSP